MNRGKSQLARRAPVFAVKASAYMNAMLSKVLTR